MTNGSKGLIVALRFTKVTKEAAAVDNDDGDGIFM